ncbi:hypothetical protein OUZ56_012967 [Daphnia magna]|uniref:Uncharacterized protein n=1 Tax=Daphnia magna TaxID=35525 RepID=A0ABQ9Z4J6_9CRUS|nr:hypothetical protein OUZ56_012967 [Daphnia magna]
MDYWPTIGRMRTFHAKLLENRDEHIEELQQRVKELEEGPDKDVEVVGPDYYKLLGVERNAGTRVSPIGSTRSPRVNSTVRVVRGPPFQPF